MLMKTLKLLFVILVSSIMITSCATEVIIEEEVYIEKPIQDQNPGISLQALLNSYEIWYVDIERMVGANEIPFLQKAFTVSFKNGVFYANNNLVGLGANGNGFGLDVGSYSTYQTKVNIVHDIDGDYVLEVTQLSDNEISIYDSYANVRYVLVGYQRNTFDYDQVFYDNIHYFLQEYETWEKVYTSEYGVLNEFDNENYLKFSYFGSGKNFKSSKDANGIPLNDIIYDYIGHYQVNDIVGRADKKTLTLDYDFMGNEFFELTVINDEKIALFHPASETVYEFKGLNRIQFKSTSKTKSLQNQRKRIKKSDFLKRKK